MIARPSAVVGYAAAVLTIVLTIAAPAGAADQIVKIDGKRLSGRIVSETADSISFETNSGGMTMRQRIARSRIKSIERQLREGPAYCPLPITGVIGEDVLARDLEVAIE